MSIISAWRRYLIIQAKKYFDMAYQTPGSVRKFVPSGERDRVRPVSSEASAGLATELAKKFQREFIMDEQEVLSLLAGGFGIHQRFVTPMATWLEKAGEVRRPNITGAMFRHFKRDGLVEHLRDDKESGYAVYGLSKHGLRILASMARKSQENFVQREKEKVASVEVMALASKLLIGGEAPPKSLLEADPKNVIATRGTANVLRLADGGYMLALEFADYPVLLKACHMLGVSVGTGSQSEKRKVGALVDFADGAIIAKKAYAKRAAVVMDDRRECDFCGATYYGSSKHAKRAGVFLRYCPDNLECHRKYGREVYAAKTILGRKPTPEDREAFLSALKSQKS